MFFMFGAIKNNSQTGNIFDLKKEKKKKHF
jgi:hypothetical protein